MTQEAEARVMELSMVSCTGCDAVFMASDRRQTCPACGGEAVGPYFEFVLDESGLHRKDGAVELKPPVSIVDEQRKVAGMPPATAPEEEETAAGEGIKLPPGDVLPLAVESFLRGGEATEDDLRVILTDLGADRDRATTAVGRLVAVRDLIRELVYAGVEAEAEVEVEVSPEVTPEPSPEGDNSSEAP